MALDLHLKSISLKKVAKCGKFDERFFFVYSLLFQQGLPIYNHETEKVRESSHQRSSKGS